MGDVIVVTNFPPIGHMRSQLTNYQVEIKKLYYYIRRPDVVERIGSYLGSSFPLFHVPVCVKGQLDTITLMLCAGLLSAKMPPPPRSALPVKTSRPSSR